MLRKIFSFVILVIFLTNSLNYVSAAMVYATAPDLNQKIYDSEVKIKSLQNGSKYIIKLKSLNKFVKNQTDLTLLKKIKSRLEEKGEIVQDKDALTYELVYYIGLIVEKRINELEEIESKDIVKLIEKSTLTQDEVKMVEDEIVKLQINLLDSSKGFIDNLLNDLKKSVNVEKTGNLKLTVEGSGAMIGNGKGELNIKDMKSKAANFDSELEAQVDLLVEASLVGGQDLKAQFSSFVNFISKDGNMYLLLKKLNYSGIEELDYSGNYSSLLEKIKDLGDNNKYVKIEDKQSAMLLNMIKNFNINSIYAEANDVLKKPMLKPYKKDGDKYLLVPTKDFCNAIKYVNNKMNSYGSINCSDDEYNKILQGSVVNGSLYIIVEGDDKHLGFVGNNYGSEAFIKIYYNDTKLEKLLGKLVIKAGKDKGNIAELTYINGGKLDFYILDKKENATISFKSLLSSLNKFTKIDYSGTIPNEGLSSSFNLENKTFNGNVEIINKDGGNLKGKLNGTLDSTNNLSSLDLGIDFDEEKDQYNYDWNNGKSSYIPTKSILKIDYSLKNEIINGKISFKENDVEKFNMTSNGKYNKAYFELNNKVKIINDYNNDEVNGNLNTKYIGTLEDNTFDLYIDFTSKDGTVKIDLKSDSKVEYKDNIKIDTPTNYIDINEIHQNGIIEVQDSPASEVPEFFE